jgi:hypothetical protein
MATHTMWALADRRRFKNARKRVIHVPPLHWQTPLPFSLVKQRINQRLPSWNLCCSIAVGCAGLIGMWAGNDGPSKSYSCVILTNFESYQRQNYIKKKGTPIMLKPTQWQYSIRRNKSVLIFRPFQTILKTDHFYAVISSIILVWPFWFRIPESLSTRSC